jgi:hypothetical protein
MKNMAKLKCDRGLTSRRSQPPLALSVPLSRFASQVGGGSAFYVRPLTHAMRFLPFILMLALFGCGRAESPADRLSRQIQEWVPVGTPLASAQQILEQHQFSCSVVSYTNKEAMIHDHQDYFPFTTGIIRDGKFQAVTNVSNLSFKNHDSDGTLTIVNGQNTGRCSLMIHHL